MFRKWAALLGLAAVLFLSGGAFAEEEKGFVMTPEAAKVLQDQGGVGTFVWDTYRGR